MPQDLRKFSQLFQTIPSHFKGIQFNLINLPNRPLAVRHITQIPNTLKKGKLRFCVKSLPARPCHSARQVAKVENFITSIIVP